MDKENSYFQQGVEAHMNTVNRVLASHLSALTRSLIVLENAGLGKSNEYKTLRSIKKYLSYIQEDLKFKES